ncbi:uncharacterized protein At5g41620-like [Magnolia sinica]|uniref:uncharacterized protein At5g41620-like n=1 Tax=Magnolia sinica TaxID=86752 RepID=UPI002657FB75|nr:uncharacterized protein At5g41620-like [Magnolia sinica]XP_058092836.1 uncharacterized protein At5g41620-like [Magnolia sinica]
MLRQNRDLESLIGCKIRKRGCSSSSSTSSVLQNYRFKRAVLVRKRGGSSTPWKMGSRSPSSMVGIPKTPRCPPSHTSSRAKQAPVSARKLAATLWGLNEVPSPRVKEDLQERRDFENEMRRRDHIARSTRSGSLPPHLSDPSHSPSSERVDRSGTGSVRRRMSIISQKIRLNERIGGGLDSPSNASLMEIETRSRGPTPAGSIVGPKNRLKDVSNSLTTSKELLKILDRIWSVEEQHSSSMSLVSALHAELQRAHMQVDQLIQEQRSNRGEFNHLMKQFAEEKTAWQTKEKEKINGAIRSIVGDLEIEKKLRRRAECLNLKLGRELAETKNTLSNAIKELESEKRARERVERVCDGLAKGIGEDKAVVETLKRESLKIREEMEKEREMLQLTDIRREERAPMKLSEAKFQYEEKNPAVDKQRNELEAFLKLQRTKETRSGYRNHEGLEVGDEWKVSRLSKTRLGADCITEGEGDGIVEDGEEVEDSPNESDLHSIELNMDNNRKSCKWRYATGASREDGKRASVDEEIRRKSISEKVPTRSSISNDRSLVEGIEWAFGIENRSRRSGGTNRQRLSESSGLLQRQIPKKDYSDEVGRHESMKGLRDHILSSSRIGFAQGFASPTRQWDQRWPTQDDVVAARERSVGESVKGSRENGLEARLAEAKRQPKAREVRNCR